MGGDASLRRSSEEVECVISSNKRDKQPALQDATINSKMAGGMVELAALSYPLRPPAPPSRVCVVCLVVLSPPTFPLPPTVGKLSLDLWF